MNHNMFIKRLPLLMLSLTAIILLTISCTNNKVTQCNQIIQTANNAVTEATSVTNGGQTKDPKIVLKAADAMEKASKDLEAINVSDAKLKEYRDGFVKMYRDTSKATRDFVSAYERKDFGAAQAAQKNVQQATTPEKELVNGINSYCKGSEK